MIYVHKSYSVLIIYLFLLLLATLGDPVIGFKNATNRVVVSKASGNYTRALLLDDAFWVYAVKSINISGIEIPAGTSAFVISLKNYGSEVLYNITVDFNHFLRIAECNDTKQYYNSSIQPGYSVTFVFKASLRDNATASEYDLPLYVSYFINDDFYYYSVIVPVSVSGVPIIKVKAPPLYVNDEGIFDLYFQIMNIGTSPARRAVASLIPNPPYVNSYGDDWIYIGLIPANKTKLCKFTIYVSRMPVESIPIVINVTFMDQRTNSFYSVAESVLIIYNETPRVILVSSSYIPPSVFPGDKFVKISACISNPTSKLIENLTAKLVLTEDFVASYARSTDLSVGTLVPGQTVCLNFYIDVKDDARPGMRNLILILDFNGGENTFEIPIIIKEKAKFLITSYEPKTLVRGSRGVVFRVNVKNIADVTADSIYLQLMSGTVLKGEVITYVGKLMPGEEAGVTFTIEVSNSAPLGSVSLDLKITWSQDSRVFSDIYKIYVTISSASAFSSTSGVIIGLTLIISGVLLIPVLKEIRRLRR